MTTLYFEQQKTYFLVVLVFILAAAVLLALVLWPGRPYSQLSKFLLLFMTVLDLLLFWSFSQLTVSLKEDFLEFRFGIFKKRLAYNQILEISVGDYDRKIFLGYGIRFGRDKSIGYIARGGRGVRLKTLNRDYFISSDSPEQLGNELRKAI